jgi:hypothetical protein
MISLLLLIHSVNRIVAESSDVLLTLSRYIWSTSGCQVGGREVKIRNQV